VHRSLYHLLRKAEGNALWSFTNPYQRAPA